MYVRIDQSGHYRLAAKIDPLRPRTGEFGDVGIRADRHDASVANREGLQRPKLRVDGQNLAGMENVARCRPGLVPSSNYHCHNEMEHRTGHRAIPRKLR